MNSLIYFLYRYSDEAVGRLEVGGYPRWLVHSTAAILGLHIWTWLVSRPWRYW